MLSLVFGNYDLCKEVGLCPLAKGMLRHFLKTRFSSGSLPGFSKTALGLVSYLPTDLRHNQVQKP
jgi:hypothetical protein